MNAVFSDQLNELIELIYKFPSEQTAWDQFSKQLLHMFRASYIHIQAIDFKYKVLSFSQGAGPLPSEFYAQAELNYLRIPQESDPRWPVFLNPERQGWYQCHTHISDEFVQSSELYQQILLPIGLRHVASHILLRDEQLCVFWSISTAGDRPPLQPDELRFLDGLIEHLKRIVTMQRQYYEFEADSIAGFSLIDKLTQPVMLLNLSGQAVHSNPPMQRCLAEGQWLQVQDESKRLQLAPPYEAEMQALFYHVEFLLRRQISDQLLHERCLQLQNEQGNAAYLLMNLLVSNQKKLIFGSRPLVMLTLYEPHKTAEHASLCKIFDSFSSGVILLTAEQKVIYTNAYAQQLLHQTALLSINRQYLKTVSAFQERLQHCLKETLADGHAERHLAIYTQDQPEILSLNFSLLDEPSAAPDKAVIAVFFKQLHQRAELEADYLTQRYQLTRRELQICMHFFQGMDLSEIAAQMNLTLNTIRTYLKQIFAKTHCNSQSELMKLLMNAVID